MRPRSLLLSSVLLFTVGGLVPLFADSVFVSNSSGGPNYPGFIVDGTSVPYCQQSGASSASCGTSFSGHGGGLNFSSNGNASASAAFGTLSGRLDEVVGSSGRFVSSFSDDVIVTGGAGAGTLVAHYSLSAAADDSSTISVGPNPGSFSFVQGSTKTGITPSFTNFGYTPPLPNPPPPGCEPYGLCFSETFDVTSPIQFGTALPLGAETDLNSDGFGPGVTARSSFFGANSSVNLTGYTVLDGSGKVIGDAAVTRQNVPGLDLFPTPEPVTWGLMLAGLGVLAVWRLRRRRGLLLSLVGLLAAGGAVPLFADSVFVSNSSLQNAPGLGAFTGTFYCQQYGSSSASCQTASSSRPGIGQVDSAGNVSASAAFGKVSGGVTETNADGRLVASFSDDVVVTGGTGSGTLISHYSLLTGGEAQSGGPASYAFVQGSTKTGVVADDIPIGPVPVPNPPPGCERFGFCFSETFNFSSPIQFGTALPFGAQAFLGTPSGSLEGLPNSGVTAYTDLNLTGYTVLDAAGNVIGDAMVTRQTVPGLNLDFTPEPGTWALMLAGFGVLGAWRFRRRRSLLLLLVGLVAVGGAVPLRANSVLVTNASGNGSRYPGIIVDGTPIPYCQQSSASSASCMTSFSGHGSGYGYIDAGGNISASAAFGSLKGGMTEQNSDGSLVASFGDKVVVTGGSGEGTLVAHYSLVSEGEAQQPGPAGFSFVQGSTRTSVDPTYILHGGVPSPPAGPHCENVGFCFSESFDVTSPLQFGADLPLGAQMYLGTPYGGLISPENTVTAYSSVDLTGYTVLDGAGNVVSDARVTPQNVAGLDLFPAPEPVSSALMLAGLGVLGMWARFRRKSPFGLGSGEKIAGDRQPRSRS